MNIRVRDFPVVHEARRAAEHQLRYYREMMAQKTGLSDACACVGPQNGQPLCPCQMRGVIVRDGRYIMPERDLGPAVP